MKIIKLTSADTDRVLYVNTSLIVIYWRRNASSTQIYLSGKNNYVNVKETPEEIIHLIEVKEDESVVG